MASSIKDKVADAGHAVADAAKNVGHKIAGDTEKAVEFVKAKTGVGARECRQRLTDKWETNYSTEFTSLSSTRLSFLKFFVNPGETCLVRPMFVYARKMSPIAAPQL